jgi:hypothetical protein
MFEILTGMYMIAGIIARMINQEREGQSNKELEWLCFGVLDIGGFLGDKYFVEWDSLSKTCLRLFSHLMIHKYLK